MKKMTRKQTAREVTRILNMLPSRELVATRLVNFDLPDLAPGDCRFCAKGAVQTFIGGIELTRDGRGTYRSFRFTGEGTNLDWDVLHEVEDELFNVRLNREQEWTPEGRHELFKAALAKCREIISE